MDLTPHIPLCARTGIISLDMTGAPDSWDMHPGDGWEWDTHPGDGWEFGEFSIQPA